MVLSLCACRRATVLSRSVSGTSQKSFHVDHWHREKDGRSKDQHSDQPPSATKANVRSDQPPLCLGEPETAHFETKVDWGSGFAISQPAPPPTPVSDADSRTWWSSWFIRIVGGTVVALVAGGIGLMYDSKSVLMEVDKTISRGNCNFDPNEAVGEIYIDRDPVVNDIIRSFILSEKGMPNGFGVILGPTGTGKTYMIRKACQSSVQGTLYFEVRGVHVFPRALAEAIGMRTRPSLTSFLLGKYFPSFPGHFDLPHNYVECIEYVINVLGKRAKIYKEKNGRRPSLFIDGADLLAKHDGEAFIKLVDLAKGFANEGGLRIIFGCSEGNIIPLIHNTSSKSRCEVMEILDVAESQAVRYLMESGLSSELAGGVIKAVGTRMIFLVRAVTLYKKYKSKHDSEADLLNEIIEELKYLFTERGLDAVVQEMPESMVILKHLIGENSEIGFHPGVFLQRYAEEKLEKEQPLRRSMKSLIKYNTLRYTGRGLVTWHSRLVEEEVKERFMKK